MKSIISLAVIIATSLTFTACLRSTDTTTAIPATPKVDRVIPLADDPIVTVPGVFFTENFEIINNLDNRFHDTGGLSDSLMRISSTDAFSGTKSVQNTYIAKKEFPKETDPGNIGRWIHFELGVTLGDGHSSDRVQAWADGKLICDIDKQDLAGGYREQTLNGMSWDCYWNDGAPRSESRFYDDLVLSGQPIGPVRTSLTPTIQKAPFMGEEGQKQQEWQIEVAQTKQASMSISDPSRKNPEMQYLTVWSGKVSGKTDTVTISAHYGNFTGSLKDKNQLDYNTLYSIRLRQQAKNSQWSDWSPWHAAFATTWAPDTRPNEKTTAIGYLTGHEK